MNMKKQLVVIALTAFSFIGTATAQGGFQRRTVEERVKSVHEKLDSAFKPETAKMKALDAIFTDYYTTQDKTRDDMMAAGDDRDAMRAKFTELADARDAKLKLELTQEQMKIWKDTIEPSLRPQRRPQ